MITILLKNYCLGTSTVIAATLANPVSAIFVYVNTSELQPCLMSAAL